LSTIRGALADAIPRLEAAGVETPRLDAELLLAHTLGRDRTYLFAHPEEALAEEQGRTFEDLLRRREAREPLPYLLGAWEFMGLPFVVSRAVLIPRPETEVLVEAVCEQVGSDARILDVGAGSGCISIALARRLPDAEIVALEPSPEAAEVALRNAVSLGVAGRVRVWVQSFPPDAPGRTALSLPLDAVVSNPPYIPSAEVERLAPELRCYEPREALDGGPDGLRLMRSLAVESPPLLKPEGLLAVEVAQGQAEQVTALLRSIPAWDEPWVVPDLGGIDRVVLARGR
jgi:release factor glutamine methyltransferase